MGIFYQLVERCIVELSVGKHYLHDAIAGGVFSIRDDILGAIVNCIKNILKK